MSERQVSEDAHRAFRLVIGVIAGILLIGIALLITVVLIYRNNPGRHFPFIDSSPTVASPLPSPH